MMRSRLELALVASLGLAGCLNSAPPGPYVINDLSGQDAGTDGAGVTINLDAGEVLPPSSAQPLFESSVAPILTASCAGASCHSAPGLSPVRFVAGSPSSMYTVVIGANDKLVGGAFNKASAQLLTKVAGGHNAVVYMPAQITAIQTWLDAELAARASQGPIGPSPDRLLQAEWSGCMSLADWTAEGVTNAWGNKDADQAGQCKQCHSNAQGWLSDADVNQATTNAERLFNILTTQKNPKTGGMFMDYYFVVDNSNPAAAKMVINREALDRAGTGFAQHGKFTVDDIGDNNDAFSRLQRFYDKSMARRGAKTCDPPRFTP